MLIDIETKKQIFIGNEITAFDGTQIVIIKITKSEVIISCDGKNFPCTLSYINAKWVDDERDNYHYAYALDTKINFTPGNSNTGPNPRYHYAPDINSMMHGTVITDYFSTHFMVVKINEDQYEPVNLDSGDLAEVSDIACPWKITKRSELQLQDK